ncbi:DUF1772 domain-containing protein [Mesorhizobium sp. B283B1A]|uniref:anthrone oxygenase family protein n=1 Tax=Mesorhizobium TaxID=68287 RepID=UPI001CD11ED9|nr:MULTISPECIES: DUF1772 domain-containing protein [Mesorhizobium]MCA0046858.1 DUF1772 domain-containing protein [Mesorhizobium sp. B283B1A]UQS66728.1 DUF1772 domain-containing protein [Mesorhizobium opportunistum]
MFSLLQVVAVLIAALPMALSVAHALELPGKMRLDERTYRAVQHIYYPGFTIGGAADPLSVVVTGLLLFLAPAGTAGFWAVLLAFFALLATVAIYWLAIHPVNKYWMEGAPVGAPGAAFFGAGGKRDGPQPDWTELRDRWEYAHVARAVLTSIGFLALVISLVV